MSIFEKESFTLKEFCLTFSNISEEIKSVSDCYIKFSSNDNNYTKYLKTLRLRDDFLIINNQKIKFKEILSIFDYEFLKIVIRINTKPKNYEINLTWKEFEDKTKNIKKKDLEIFYSINFSNSSK